jgi:hypothetical protein
MTRHPERGRREQPAVAVFDGELRRPRRRTFCFLIAALLVVASIPAFARSWRIADFHSTVAIDDRGFTTVTERLDLVFVGSFNGIWRSIPVEYPGPRGTNYSLFVKVESVTDGDDRPLKYEVSRDGDFKKIKIYVPGASDTSRTVLITYSSPNAVRWFDDHDEFYWNVTGNDWPVPIDHASALVSLPENTTGSLKAQAFTGVYGSHDQEATAVVNGSHVEFETTNPMPMRGGMTVDVFIPKGLLREPGALTKALWFLRSNIVVLVPLWFFAVMFTLWWFKGRDPDPGRSIAPQYEPPPNMTPAEAGTLIDDTLDPRDITSTIVDLAVRGYLKIEQTDKPGLFSHHKDYDFHLLKEQATWMNDKDLVPFERVILENMFWGAKLTSLSGLKNRFYTAIPVIKSDIFSSLRTKGMYFLDPQSAAGYSFVALLIIAAPLVLGQVTGRINFFESIGLAIAAGVVSAIIFFLFARVMSAKTMLGARTRIQVLGFQDFMNRVDADRIKRLPPDTFEKYLPYAMALGVEAAWAKAFAGIVTQPPSWYSGPYTPGYWNPMLFTTDMHTMANSAHQAMIASPRASSTGSGWSGGGGFSGGGFSGGGFGGGGGGAF